MNLLTDWNARARLVVSATKNIKYAAAALWNVKW